MLPSVHMLFHLLTTFTTCLAPLIPLHLPTAVCPSPVRSDYSVIFLQTPVLSSHFAQSSFKLHVCVLVSHPVPQQQIGEGN